MKNNLLATAAILLLSACSHVPLEAHFNRGEPEGLLDMSSESVNISLDDAAGTDELIGWINRDQPSSAELSCAGETPMCNRARDILNQFGVPFEEREGRGTSVALRYERVMARDCENRYIDNSINPYNLNHPTFGCSIASNMVSQVSDKRQFVNPSLLGFHDGKKSAQAVRNYYKNTSKAVEAGTTSFTIEE